jgi:hypothetical protein
MKTKEVIDTSLTKSTGARIRKHFPFKVVNIEKKIMSKFCLGIRSIASITKRTLRGDGSPKTKSKLAFVAQSTTMDIRQTETSTIAAKSTKITFNSYTNACVVFNLPLEP